MSTNTGEYINETKTVYSDDLKKAISVRPLGFLEMMAILEDYIVDNYHKSIRRYTEDLASPEAEVQFIIQAQKNEPKGDSLFREALLLSSNIEGQQVMLLRGLEKCNPDLGMTSEALVKEISQEDLVKIQDVLLAVLIELANAIPEDDAGTEDDNGKKDKPEPETEPEPLA